jgi:hypothetical protein
MDHQVARVGRLFAFLSHNTHGYIQFMEASFISTNTGNKFGTNIPNLLIEIPFGDRSKQAVNSGIITITKGAGDPGSEIYVQFLNTSPAKSHIDHVVLLDFFRPPFGLGVYFVNAAFGHFVC